MFSALRQLRGSNFAAQRMRHSILIGILVFVVMGVLTQLLAYQRYVSRKDAEHQIVYYEMNAVRSTLENALQRSFDAAKGLAYLATHFDGLDDFEVLANKIKESNNYVDVLELTEQGVVTNVYPLKGNEAMLGYDIFNDAEISEDANRALESKGIFFQGPLSSGPGKDSFIGGIPIIVQDKFRGFAIIFIRLETLLSAAGIDTLKNHRFSYQLSAIDPNSQKEYLLLQSKDQSGARQSTTINLPGGDGAWKLQVGSKTYSESIRGAKIISLLGILFSMFGLFVWVWSKEPQKEVLDAYKITETTLNRINDSVVSVDRNWRYTFLNEAAMATHPLGKKTLGKVMWDVHPGMKGTIFWDKYHEAMTNAVVVEVEGYYEPMDTWFSVKAYPSDAGLTFFYSDITIRKAADQKLIASEKRFKALIENMSEAIVINDEHSNLLYQSPSVTRILGYSWEERKGKPVTDYIHPDDYRDFITLYEELRRIPGKPFPFQYRFLHKLGHYVWLEGVVTNLLHEPSVNAFVANYHDISERKKAEESLHREHTLLRILVDNIPDLIYVKDKNSRFLLNNVANVALLGRSTEEETLGKSDSDFFPPEIAQAFLDDDKLVFESGEPVLHREEPTTNFAGKSRLMLTTKIPLRDLQGNVVGLVGISRDITEQKKAEVELRNTNYFLEMAQQVGNTGHWISEVGDTGNLIWSKQTCHIFGIKPEDFDGKVETFFQFIHPDDRESLKETVADAIAFNRDYSFDHRIVVNNGEVKWVHEQGNLIHGEAMEGRRLVGIVQDITIRKQAENKVIELNAALEERVRHRTEQLESANKELEAFTYSVSHDLRSPLRIIDGYAKILVEDYENLLDKEGNRTIGIIMSNARRMGQLIDDLLNFSKAGRDAVRKKNIDMKFVVNGVLAELSEGGTDIPQDLQIGTLDIALCDENLVKQVWINLISNAIKYSSTKPKPEIRIGMQKEDGKSIYYVKDNGAGFDMQYYHKLFGVFQRLHSHHEFSGTGVGLAIVNRIVKRHGGSVWAESTVDVGCCFYFTLG